MGDLTDLAQGLRRAADNIRGAVQGRLAVRAARLVQQENLKDLRRERNAEGKPLGMNTGRWTEFKARAGFSMKRGQMSGGMIKALGSKQAVQRKGRRATFGVPRGATGHRGKPVAAYAGVYNVKKADGKLIGPSRRALRKIRAMVGKRMADVIQNTINAAI